MKKMVPQTASMPLVMQTSDAVRAVRREHMYAKLPRSGVTKEMVMQMAEEFGVQFVDMQFTDILGTLKAKTIPVHKLEDAIDHGIWFDGSSIKGFARITETDMFLKPDLNTFAVLPWTKDGPDVTARLICDSFMPDGKPFEGDPRRILKRQLEELAGLGMKFLTGPELEFFIFKPDENGNISANPHDDAGYFDQTNDLGLEIRRVMSFALDEMGLEIEALHHEVAQGQHEINFKYDDALRTADNAISMKQTLKAIANKMGLYVSFMPKPIFGINGSGMHVHQSLSSLEDGTNKFYDKNGKYGLSSIALSFMAGQMKHIKAMNAIMNPTVNSYKRLVIGYEAPVNVAWGQRNRSALIRVPRVVEGTESKATRCELRCPDPSSNPYLTLSVMLAAGLDGIKKGMVPPDAVEDNIWRLTPEEMKAKNVTQVASSLKEALEALRDDEVIRGALGEYFFHKFYDLKMAEYDEYRMSVSDWEREMYLNV